VSEDVNTVHVTLDQDRDYDILIGSGLLRDAAGLIAQRFDTRRLLVIADPNAQGHLPRDFNKDLLVLEEGESAKSFVALEKTLHWILDRKPDRKTLIVALGGGVVGDHAGFAAAIALRGLDFVQVPTTLLAQVDSSVGGKTGINSTQGKNLIGAFHQPKLVIIDTDTLSTLPDRQMKAGYSEMVKYAFISDKNFFTWLSKNGANVLARDKAALDYAITISCTAKAKVVAADEREAGLRALLNFGHTFAHALEAACQYDRRVLHGEAVSIGMSLAFDASARMGLCPQAEAETAISHMRTLGLLTRISEIQGFPEMTADQLIDLMGNDKKVSGGKLTFILTRGIGEAFVTQDVDMDAVRQSLILSAKG